MHLPTLVSDLALILIVAGAVSVLFRVLDQPTVLGYLLAGVLVGPHVKFIPTVGDPENVKAWGELGVIFLLFFLGLEFSFKKLLKVGKASLVTACFEVIAMGGLGVLLGRVLGWDLGDAVFLGGILSISSTTIIVKAFEENAVKSQLFATIVVGVLIIEDLLAVLILALLGTFAITQSFQGSALLLQGAKLGSFLLITIPVGLWLMPKILRRAQSLLNDESRVVIALGFCLGFVLLASTIGFSPALGAFVIGALMADTLEGERIERVARPIRDLFGAVFFTSIGMLVNVGLVKENLGVVLIITVVTVLGKFASSAFGMVLAGQDKRVALQTGLSLAQIGEFSFIIASLGLGMNVIRPEIYPITVAVSVLTSFLTPYLVRLARRLPLESAPAAKSAPPKLWDAHLVQMELHPHFKEIGKTLEEIKLRERFGATVVRIHRGERKILAPTKDTRLHAYDQILVFGDDKKLGNLERHLKTDRYGDNDGAESQYSLIRWIVPEHDTVVGKSLADSGLRERFKGQVLGLERQSEKILNPESRTVILENDILWIYGVR